MATSYSQNFHLDSADSIKNRIPIKPCQFHVNRINAIFVHAKIAEIGFFNFLEFLLSNLVKRQNLILLSHA